MIDLWIFQAKCKALRFWHGNPAKTTLMLGLLAASISLAGLLGVVHLALSHTGSAIEMLLILTPVVGIGSFVLFQVSERWLRSLTRTEQVDLIRKLPRGAVPPDRRVCKLEARWIEQTQGPAKKAWLSHRALSIKTNPALGKESPRRL